MIENALQLAAEAHKGQTDKSGNPYIFHPLRVGIKLFELEADADLACAGFLHDVVEDNSALSVHGIEVEFGSKVADLVGLVTRNEGETYEEYITRALSDRQSALIKLVDVIDNLRPGCPDSLRERYRKTLAKIEAILPDKYVEYVQR